MKAYTSLLLILALSSQVSFGETYFDQFLKAQGGDLPTTDTALGEELAKYFQTNLSTTTLPFSRAPEKDHVSPGTPVRIIATGSGNFSQSAGDTYLPKVFLRLNYGMDQIQVISFDPEKKKYIFKNYKDYLPKPSSSVKWEDKEKTQRPIDTNVNQNFCQSCHQGQTPHFTRFPWKDTANTANGVTINENLIKGELPNFSTFLSMNNIDNNFSEQGIFSLDALVRRSAKGLQAMNVCENICQGDKQCKKELIYLMLIGGSEPIDNGNLSPRDYAVLNENFKKHVKKWDENNFAYPSTVIPDFQKDGDKFVTTLYKMTGYDNFDSNFDHNESHSNSDDRQEKIDGLSRLSDRIGSRQVLELKNGVDITYLESGSTRFGLDSIPGLKSIRVTLPENEFNGSNPSNPSFKRPLVGHIPIDYAAEHLIQDQALTSCFNLQLQSVKQLQNNSITTLRDIVNDGEKLDKLIDSEKWPLDGAKLLDALKDDEYKFHQQSIAELDSCNGVHTQVTSDDAFKFALLDTAIEDIQDGTLAALNNITAKDKFNKYCQSCHAGENALIYLPMGDLKVLANYKNGLPIKKMKCFNMPADHARVKPRVEERAQMIEYLETIRAN